MTVRTFHRTTHEFGEAILREGFQDSEGTWGTGRVWSGVWLTIDQPWDIGIAELPPGDDPALLVVDIPLELFERCEWVGEQKGYREALVPLHHSENIVAGSVEEYVWVDRPTHTCIRAGSLEWGGWR